MASAFGFCTRSRSSNRISMPSKATSSMPARLTRGGSSDGRAAQEPRISASSNTIKERMASPTLRERLRQRKLLVAPGVYDMVSLRLADTFGFEALYMTGFGAVASHLGLPDAGIATFTDMVGRVKAMASQSRAPLIADADTGYGGLLNVRHTVRGYEEAGAAGIQIEDQEVPKKCGHTTGRRVI